MRWMIPALAAALLTGCLLRGQPSAAEQHRSAVDLCSEAIALESEGRWREAIVLLEQSIALAPSPAAHCHLGRCQMELGDLASAENHLRRALELSPSYALAENSLAQIEAMRQGPQPRMPAPPEPEPVAEVPAPAPQPPQPVIPPPTEEPPAAVEPPPAAVEPPPAVESPPAVEPPVIASAPEPEPEPEPEPVATPEVEPEVPSSPPPSSSVPPDLDEVRALLFPALHGDPTAPTGGQRLRETSLDTPEFHMAQAAEFERAQDYVSALREYRAALQLDPMRVDPLLSIGRLHAQLGHSEEAMRAYEQAMEIAPTDPEVPFQLGNHFYRQGEAERAVVFYEQALRFNPEHRSALNNLGAALRELGRFEGALDALQRAVALDPTYAPPHRNLGNVYADLGRDREALEAYRQYVRLSGSDSGEVASWIRDLEQRLGAP
ncbi:tetratricopeptide repeat protein [Candidatus Sumerlaeota bacterium]|nr:tetratricopeptide repeat protein [Candidatus Sumerlaeota bacterium]